MTQEISSTASETATQCPWLSQLKPYNGQETFENYLVEHYALMAMNPATIEQSRWRAKELKADFPTLGILIAKRLKEMRNDQKTA